MRKVVRVILFFLLFFLFQTSYAQKVTLEYFNGREIVVYTPDYKLLLLEELEKGDEIPAGSIIETGRKSTCEFRLDPDGTIIKIADRTTFKIEELQEPDYQGKNQFKLISGAMRAVTGKKSDQNEYVFLCGSSTVYPDKADFGITVKKGWEEIAFVLEGRVKYVNAQGNEVFINADQMAGGLDENFKAGTMSVRIKRLANSLAFSHLRPKDTGIYQEGTYQPTESPTEEPGPVITPAVTIAPGTTPTPAPIVTVGPTREPVVEYLPEPTEATEEADERVSEDSEKTSAAFDPTRDELYPADEYAFTAKYNYSDNFQIREVNDEFVIVSFAPPEVEEEAAAEKEGVAEPPPALELPEYTLLEIYNVFENKAGLSGKAVYSGFVDSVYLAKVEDKVFYFAFLWEGANKNIMPGFYLYPTGRLYSPEEDKIIIIEGSGDSEDGEVVVMEEELDFSEESGRKTEKKKKEKGSSPVGFYLDIGWSLTFSFFSFDSGDENLDFIINLLLWLSSLRARTFVDTTIKFTSWFGIGAEVSAATFYMTINDVGVYFIDFPVRGFLRFGTKDLYIQPYCGYYFSFMLPDGGEFQGAGYDGLDVGATVSLGGFYLEGSYVFGELVGGINYFRVGIGLVLNDILGTGK